MDFGQNTVAVTMRSAVCLLRPEHQAITCVVDPCKGNSSYCRSACSNLSTGRPR